MSTIRVAIIEDHALTRMGLLGALEEQADIEIVGEAATATEGLQLLWDQLPDVAIVDLGLPDMDGIELVQRFKKSSSQTDAQPTRILILTMHHHAEEVLAAFAAGADSYCVKDTDIEELIEAVRTTAEHHSWIDPTVASIVLEQIRNGSLSPSEALAGAEISIHGLAPDAANLLQTSPLTKRELEILELIVGGYSNADISESLFLSMGTVKTHVRNILSKLCASDRTEAAVRALRSGLVK